MSWKCAAITNGATFYSDGTIAPCCMIDHTYRKPLSAIRHSPFLDLVTGTPPAVCHRCHNNEELGIFSYRQGFNARVSSSPGLQFVDIRNFNLCNAKCRTCGPYNSSQWAQELGHTHPIVRANLDNYKDLILTDSLQQLYYTGGEPFINREHWDFLELLVEKQLSKNITLQYNTNLSTIKYKDKNIIDLWKNFKQVMVTASVDAIGEKFNYLRSGIDWQVANNNLDQLLTQSTVDVTIGTTVSILNLWFIEELLDYFDKKCTVMLTDLSYPDYLSLSAVPDGLQELAIDHLDSISKKYHDNNKIKHFRAQVINNCNQHLFSDTLNHVLLLDHIRNENLFDLLPFTQIAKSRILYE
jgi:sulfatase maturation enzyme AslB (radical SAM superfamily)